MAVKVAVKGVLGRMGQAIARILVAGETGATLASAIERTGADGVGKTVRDACGIASDVVITDDTAAALAAADVLIDFTVTEATLSEAPVYAEGGKPIVIGTTGFTNEQRDQLRSTLQPVPYVLAPNMSVGVNVLFNLVRQAATALGDEYDVEVFEAHHRYKKDSPSGTAVGLAEAAADALGRKYPDDAVFRQRGLIGERQKNEIGMQVVRGGDIVGDHTVFFVGLGERVEITHRAHTRDTFARGAIRAALWVADKPVGAYDMQDVLGFSENN